VGWDSSKKAKVMRSSYKKKEDEASCCQQSPGDQFVYEEVGRWIGKKKKKGKGIGVGRGR